MNVSFCRFAACALMLMALVPVAGADRTYDEKLTPISQARRGIDPNDAKLLKISEENQNKLDAQRKEFAATPKVDSSYLKEVTDLQSRLTPAGRFEGTVKSFDKKKGYGFITPTDGSKDVFVNISGVQRSNLSELQAGQRLEYEIHNEKGKTSAVNLTLK